MPKYCAANVRIKREYLIYLKEAKRQSEASLDAAAGAIARFEAYTQHRDFKAFCQQQAVAFKRRLAEQNSAVTGGKLSKATLHATLSHLKRFFQWLAGQPSYKSRFTYSEAEYFNVSEKDARIATARRHKSAPTLEQVRHLIANMPAATELEQRNRALVAFIMLTGARDSAVASAKLKHIDLDAGCFYQDAREVKTKFSKTFTTFFFPVGDDIGAIFAAWVDHLRRVRLWGHDDPLFPKTRCTVGKSQQFQHDDLVREHWATATPIRQIFQRACAAAGLPYFNPHSVRNTLVMIGSRRCKTPEQFKAWSQNLGHDGVLTTLVSYGTVSDMRQGEILHDMVTHPPG
ncbi:tyrosine-type recombinase/integrase [Panacagrimonas sp.]|uniref:tyrosine-type recombinase/integrase n=1 Tax=Panacagrimonas sp. TaxID=2480088 RepID=UPI003B520A94